MSYILDSLKKSEQQRQEQQAELPNLNTVHGIPTRKRPLWVWLVLGGLLLNALVLIGLLGPWAADDAKPGNASTLDDEAKSATASTSAVAPVASSSVPSNTLHANSPAEKMSGRTESGTAARVGVREVSTEVQVDKQEKTKFYLSSELPTDLARRLAPLDITLHYFAQKPERRMARINGRNLHQGEALQPGIRILEINPDGVVIDANGYHLWLEKP